jgi:uncharacterized protein
MEGPMSDDNVGVVRAIYEAFARGDVPAVLGAMTDDVEWHEAEGMPQGGVYRGRDAIVENVLGPLLEDVPDFAVTPEEIVASGDMVAVVTRYTGTGKATGKRLDLQVVHVWDVRGGKVARFRQFADTVRYRDVVPVAAEAGSPG